MGIIGYDGRLRPAGQALNVSAPNGFDVGAVEKIGNAQPKFVEETMKLVNTLAGGSLKYGNALAGIAEEEDRIKGEEQFSAERRRVEDEFRKIKEDDSLTPEEKEERAKAVKFSTPTTGRERFDKRLAIRGNDFIHNQLTSIYNAAESERDNVRRAELEATELVEGRRIANDFTAALPEFLTGVSDVNQIPEKVKKYLEDKFIAEAFNNPANKADVIKFKAGMEASFILSAGNAYVAKTKAEMKASTETLLGGAATGGDVSAAMSTAKVIVGDPTRASVFPTYGAQARAVVATGISCSENIYNSVVQTVGTESDVQIKNASVFLNNGNPGGYDDAVREVNAYIVSEYDELISCLKADKVKVIEEINGNEKLSEEERTAMRNLASQKYDELIRKADSKKVADITKLRSSASSTKKKAGENMFSGVQKVLRGDDYAPSEAESRFIAKLNPSKESIDRYNAEGHYDPKVKSEFFDIAFKGMSEAAATEATIASLQYEISGIDLSTKNEQNLFEIEKILDRTATLFRIGSPEWNRVAEFARNNIVKERNLYGGKVNDWVSRNFYKGKSKEDWLRSASDNDVSRRDHYMMLLSEFQGSEPEFEKYATDLSKMLSYDAALDIGFGGIATLGEMVERAELKAVEPDTRTVGSVSTEKQKTFVESLYDTYADNPEELARAIAQHKQRPIWEQNFAEYEYRAELAGDKAELDALKRGRSVKQAEAERANAVNGFWKDSGHEFGAYYHGRREYHGMQGKQAVIDGLKKRAEQEEKDKKERAKYDNERAELLRALEAAGLPLSRREYNSGFFGIGGYSVNDSDELELPGFVREDRELSNSEIREVLKQLDEIRKKEKLAAPEREAARKRIAELEAKKK